MHEHFEPTRAVLDYYRKPAPISSAGHHASLLAALPDKLSDLVHMLQGLLIYDDVAMDYYGVAIPRERHAETHLRRVEPMLDCLLAMDERPLTMPRALDRRLVGVCHHYALLLAAALRAKNIPARTRVGFGAYFNAPFYEDHMVCEYWSAEQRRWILVDAQLDEVWRAKHHIRFDVLDVPRSQFVIAGDAWQACRKGAADPAKYGIYKGDLRGLWFIAGDIVRDLASLNKVEALPWDVWGAIPPPNEALRTEQFAFFASLAALTQEPDAAFEALRRIYDEDDALRVPTTVLNALLQRQQVFA